MGRETTNRRALRNVDAACRASTTWRALTDTCTMRVAWLLGDEIGLTKADANACPFIAMM